MTIQIQTYNDCPYCGEHILYHCETLEKIKNCKWMKELRECKKREDKVT